MNICKILSTLYPLQHSACNLIMGLMNGGKYNFCVLYCPLRGFKYIVAVPYPILQSNFNATLVQYSLLKKTTNSTRHYFCTYYCSKKIVPRFSCRNIIVCFFFVHCTYLYISRVTTILTSMTSLCFRINNQ